MTEAEIAIIEKLADVCRAKGVTSLKNDGFEMVLGPVDVEEKPSARAQVEAENCRCGHPEHGHQNGQCLMGCDPTRCVAEAKP